MATLFHCAWQNTPASANQNKVRTEHLQAPVDRYCHGRGAKSREGIGRARTESSLRATVRLAPNSCLTRRKLMLRVVAAVAALAIGATVVLAQNAAVIDQRKQAMKAFGGAAKGPGAHEQGRCALRAAQGAGLPEDHPGDGRQGQGPVPRRYQDRRDRHAARRLREEGRPVRQFDKIAADAKAAEGAIKDEASFKAEWPKVVSNCGGCHKEYRKPPAAVSR